METQINPMDDGFISAKNWDFFTSTKKRRNSTPKKKQKVVYTKEQNKLEVKYHTINFSTLTPKEV